MSLFPGLSRSILASVAILVAAAGCQGTTQAPTPLATFSEAWIPTSCCAFEGRTTEEIVAAVRRGEAGPLQYKALRARGPGSLDALLAALDAAAPGEETHLRAAIDAVAAQRDADASRLFWYTDLDAARAVAKKEGKPILSLRLLGRLDEEMSCANSRFFRTALYANATVSKALRERFVLHWSSERPAPKVTIDFGDGRKVERTITGNSLHYVLDGEARVLDAIPGLYGPQAFLGALGDAEGLYRSVADAPATDAGELIQAHHAARAEQLDASWKREVGALGFGEVDRPGLVANPSPSSPPPAAVAMNLAMPKAAVEMPVLASTKLGPAPSLSDMREGDVERALELLATRSNAMARLDASSRALIARKRPMSWADARGPRPLTEPELAALLATFEGAMALDTVKNEYRFHATIHQWLASEAYDLGRLNAKVYAEMFLTPADDPWLGLVPPKAYSALEADGLVE